MGGSRLGLARLEGLMLAEVRLEFELSAASLVEFI